MHDRERQAPAQRTVDPGGLLVRVAAVFQLADGEVGTRRDDVRRPFRIQLVREPVADGRVVLRGEGESLGGEATTELQSRAAIMGFHLECEREREDRKVPPP